VARGKYQDMRYSDSLVGAAADLIAARWRPQPAPEWITAIPSRRHGKLVLDFAQRLAAKLGLPFLPALRPRGDTRPQKEMLNSPMQLRNVLKVFSVECRLLQVRPTGCSSHRLAAWLGLVNESNAAGPGLLS
jgi:ATP-dependent DNA helicase RecQ